MGGSAAPPLPYSTSTVIQEMPAWKKKLLGLTPDAPEYSPYKAMSRQGGTYAKIAEGMTTKPSWAAMHQAFGTQPGTDLTKYIEATRQGTRMPATPIPASPAANEIPKFVPPSEEAKKKAAGGGLMSLAKTKGYAEGGLTKQEEQWLKTKQKQGEAGKLTGANKTRWENLTAKKQRATTDSSAPSVVSPAQGLNVVTPFYDPSQAYGEYGGVTNPVYQQALDRLRAVSQAPESIGQGTGIMSDAASRLMGMGSYTPQQVEAARIARGDIRDVAAQQAQVERMQGGPNVEAILSEAARMEGPGSWTDPNVAQKYMSPYMQNVVDIQKREAQRDFGKEMAKLSGQAAGMGAFGGSRAALERAEMRRNQAQKLADIQAMGQQQAYQSGMGQYGAESQLGQAARQSNLQAAMQSILANQQAGMTAQQLNQLYGQGGFQAQAANQAAQNQAYNNYVQQQLTAQGMNQGMDWNTASQNAQMQMQAALANQQAGLQANAQNISAISGAGQLGQGIGSLGNQTWNLQQNIPQMWGQAGQTVQNLAQQQATGAQQTGLNWMNFMNQAYAPSTNLVMGTSGGVTQQNVNQAPR